MEPIDIDIALTARLWARPTFTCQSFLKVSLDFSKESLIEGHAESAAEFKRMADDPGCAMRPFTHIVLDPLRPSPSFKELEDMHVKDLLATQDPPVNIHHGRILRGTLCVKPFLTGGVRTVLEDKKGDAVLVVIDNAVCTTASEAEVCSKYPEGMEVAIKEPAFMPLWPRKYGIKVGNPADVMPIADICLAEKAKTYFLQRGVEQMRVGLDCVNELVLTRANCHLAANELTRALYCYNAGCRLLRDMIDTKAAATCSSSSVDPDTTTTSTAGSESANALHQEVQYMLEVIYFHRCGTYLRLGSYQKALADANMCLQLNPSWTMCKMRIAKCLHGMHKYDEELTCLEVLEASLDTSDSDSESDLLAEIRHQKCRASVAKKQSGLGIYEFDDEDISRYSGTEHALGCAPFVGAIELREGVDSGECRMFASQDVKPGELLLVSNPLARGKAHQSWPQIMFYSGSCLLSSREPEPGQHKLWNPRYQNLFVESVAKAQHSPQYAAQLRSMLPGTMWKPHIDMFTNDWDDDLFGDVRSLEEHQFHLTTVDIHDIRRVVEIFGKFDGALYGLPSFFKHSCAPNCVCYTETTQSGGAMFIASTTMIHAGEELSINLVSNFHSNLVRSEQLGRQLQKGFCSCQRCRFEDQAVMDNQDLGALLCTHGYPALLGIEAVDAMQMVEDMLATSSEARKGSLQTIILCNGNGEHVLRKCCTVKSWLARILHSDIDSPYFTDEKHKDWIRCSYALAFVMPVLSAPTVAAESMDEVVQVLTAVEPATSTALTILAFCRDKMEPSDIEKIVETRYLSRDLYFPFKDKNSVNLLKWGLEHGPRFIYDLY